MCVIRILPALLDLTLPSARISGPALTMASLAP